MLRSFLAFIAILAFSFVHNEVFAQAGPVIPLSDADRAQLDALLGKGVVGEALPSPPLGSVDVYLPPEGRAATYRVVTQGEKASTETHKSVETTEAEFKPGWHYTIAGVAESYFQKDSAGKVLTVAEKDFDNKVLSRFTPGDPLILPGLQPGQSAKSSLEVAVYDLSNLKKVSHSGSLDVTYTYLGTYRVTVPAGAYDAALVKWSYSGKIGPANIKDSQYRFLAKGAGMVAMIQIRSISAMLIYNDHTKRGKLLEN